MSEELKTLLAKDAIRDQIYTYCRALDRIDVELGCSIFSEDSKVDYGEFKGSGRDFFTDMMDQHRGMISTHHMMTNILIEVKGDKAVSETYMYAACKFPGKEKPFTVQARCRDIDKWEFRDGKWVIVERIVCGDNTFIIVPNRDLPNYNGDRDNKEDPAYKYFEEFRNL